MHGMNHPEENLHMAARDIRYLLDKGYPKGSAVRFVSDHYGLEKNRRYILSRNVLAPEIASVRRMKSVPCSEIRERHVIIGGYNVLITIENYLKGEDMWIGDDGFIRDNRGVFRNHVNDTATLRSVELMLLVLRKSTVGDIIVLLDEQMSMSGQLALDIRQKMAGTGVKGRVLTSASTDHDLKIAGGNTIVATADGVIIDAVEMVVDIPYCVMKGDPHSRKLLYSLSPSTDQTTKR
ncbi:DUF434 domain-containing protein [Methanolobus sp.]|uniref:DUF434 domain-containing protein n=1 Tax=Methanolobus sp. TaxID=1874737 RepID=UPI0025D91654|nr:DUF434 domain-containing protein [Methanolobus sp.]